jgi:hypothetical protein
MVPTLRAQVDLFCFKNNLLGLTNLVVGNVSNHKKNITSLNHFFSISRNLYDPTDICIRKTKNAIDTQNIVRNK